jgi:glycosyltransferase involved in cell wall biosynthesis
MYDLNLTAVSPSRWLADCTAKSSLLKRAKVETVPNGIDLSAYRPFDQHVLRRILNLPQDRKILLFGSIKSTEDKRKGHDLLKSALKQIEENNIIKNMAIVLFGDSEPADLNLKRTDIPIFFLGHLHDDISLAMLYGASDIFVLPTREDNLPNTLIEAMACGTPCVSFDVGGVSDIIRHKENGYLARPLDTDDLAEGIRRVLEDTERHKMLSRCARKTAEEKFDIEKIAVQYEEIYRSIV